MRYYIAVNGKPLGPFEPAQLLQHGLTANSLVWHDGMPNWVYAGQVPELMALLSNQTYNYGGHGPANSQQPPYSGGPQPNQQASQGYSYNQQWSQPQYGPSRPQRQMMPKNWLTEAVIVTVISAICCCNIVSMILGVVAIIKANGVNAKYQRGDVNGANDDATWAKRLVLVAVAAAVIWGIVQMYQMLTDPSIMQAVQERSFDFINRR